MNKPLKTFTVEFLLQGNSSQPMYFTNVMLLSGKNIVHIQTFDDTSYSVPGKTVVDSIDLASVCLTMLNNRNFRIIENLPCGSLSASAIPTSKHHGLPITGKFNFDKSYLVFYKTTISALAGKILPITFTYTD